MNSFELQYANILPAVLLIVELIFAVVLFNLYLNMKRKKKEIDIEEHGTRLYDEAMAKGMGEAHFILDRVNMTPAYFTDNFEKLVGISDKRISGDIEALSELMSRKEYKTFWNNYNSWNRQDVFEFDYQSTVLNRCFMRIIIVPSGDEADFFIFRDVTEEKLMLAGLQDKLEEAEEESQSKTTFLSRMSHEIRTPINGIIGMLSLAHKQVKKDSTVDDYLNKAENLSAHLIALVNDILDMSRIEAGKIELENKTFDIRELADKLSNMFKENIEAKGVRFDIELLDFEDYYLLGDEFRLSQVIVNFLSNASKFTSEGEITVTFRQMLKENGMVDLLIRVHDTGIGMQPEFVSRIFRPFEQESTDIAKTYGGTGLGMAISDQIIRLMGGEIVIDSMPGRGSDFTVYLNLPASDEQHLDVKEDDEYIEYTDDYTFEGKHILMAEDNEINADIAREILSDAGAYIDIAENGKAAIDKFLSNPPGYYDFILMDIQMPVMNGREAARRIRQSNHADAKDILIFALSADAFLEDERLSIEAGMNGHFAKPVNYDYVRKQIGQIASRRLKDKNER